MKLIKRHIIIAFLVLGNLFGFSQTENKEGEVFVINNFKANSPKIHLKWISKHVYFPQGCFIYRKLKGTNNWVKIKEMCEWSL